MTYFLARHSDYIQSKEDLPILEGEIQKLTIKRIYSRDKTFDEPGVDYKKEDRQWDIKKDQSKKNITQEYKSLEELSTVPDREALAIKYPYIEHLETRLSDKIREFEIEVNQKKYRKTYP